MNYILRKEQYGKGILELRLSLSEKAENMYPVLLFEEGEKKPVWSSQYGRHNDALKDFEGLALALKLGRGISSTKEDEL